MDDVTRLFESGVTLLSEGRHEEAARCFTAADEAARASGDPAARLNPLLGLLRVAESAGAAEAAATLAGHLGRAGDKAEVPLMALLGHVSRARHLHGMRRFDASLEACGPAFEAARQLTGHEAAENLAQVHLARGFALMGLERATEAVTDFSEARRLGCAWTAEHRLTLAIARVRAGETAEALGIELRALADEAGPETSPTVDARRVALRTLVELELARGAHGAAQAALDQLCREPEEADALSAWFAAELALARGAPHEALRWLARGGQEPQLDLARGKALAALDRPREAIGPLMRAARASDRGVALDAKLAIADLRLRAGDAGGGEKLIREVTGDPTARPDVRARGMMLAARGQALRGATSEAAVTADAALAIARAHGGPRLRAVLGLEALRLGVCAMAEAELTEALEATGDARLCVEEALLRATQATTGHHRNDAAALLARASIHAGDELALQALVAETAARLGLGGALDVV